MVLPQDFVPPASQLPQDLLVEDPSPYTIVNPKMANPTGLGV